MKLPRAILDTSEEVGRYHIGQCSHRTAHPEVCWVFMWDWEDVGHDKWMVPHGSFPPAWGPSAPGTSLGAEGHGQDLSCLQSWLMVLMGHLGALSLQANEDMDRRQMASPCGGMSPPWEAWLESREQCGDTWGHGSRTRTGAPSPSPPAAQRGKSQGQR